MPTYYLGGRVFLPFCIQQLEDGRYIVLNSRYLPLGQWKGGDDDLDTHPAACWMHITPELAGKLSWDGSDRTHLIQLCPEGMQWSDPECDLFPAYIERLRLLSQLQVQLLG